jgi:Rieske Fe-S protein
LGIDALARLFGYQPAGSRPTVINLGPLGDYPPGSRTPLPQAEALLIHDASGLHALSLICPHLGCVVGQTPAGFTCPCHGSQFTQDGALLHGPASQPLKELQVEQTAAGDLILHL